MTSLSLRRPLQNRLAALGVALCLTASSALLSSSQLTAANASPGGSDPLVTEPARPAFYEPPATLPAANGAVIRTQFFSPDPLMTTWLFYNVKRIMYKTTNRLGQPIAVTGSLFVPNLPWLGGGKRPIIGYAPGTQGLGDKCAPSRVFSNDILEYEGIFMDGLLKAGYAVVLTDYEGLGTRGVHTYMERVSQAHAVLDSVRAAQHITGIKDGPIGLTGYSQGGGGAAAAAELAKTYAPELDIKGVSAGAVPADLGRVAEYLDNSTHSGFTGYATRGIAASYDIDVRPYLNEAGLTYMRKIEQACVLQVTAMGKVDSKTLTVDGRAITEHMREEPWVSILDEQRIGRRAPLGFPIQVTHALKDDTIPYDQGVQMARNWCRGGSNVTFVTMSGSSHELAMFPHTQATVSFFKQRFKGATQVNGCGTF